MRFASTIGDTCGIGNAKRGITGFGKQVREMKPESAKRIIDAYFDVFDELSIRTFNQGFAFVLDGLEERLRALRRVRTREGFQAMLLKEPEPDEFDLDAQVEMIYLFPYTLRKAIPEVTHDLAQLFPQDPGGRPPSLSEKESKEVCQEIGKLFAKGVRLLDAQTRLALRMSQKKRTEVSVRTIQRAWQGRAKWFDAGNENPETFRQRVARRLREARPGRTD
jgi:hypothetical protein